jgi:hypothetical protein
VSPEARLHLVELRIRGMLADRELLLAELILQRTQLLNPDIGLNMAIAGLRSTITDLKALAFDLG